MEDAGSILVQIGVEVVLVTTEEQLRNGYHTSNVEEQTQRNGAHTVFSVGAARHWVVLSPHTRYNHYLLARFMWSCLLYHNASNKLGCHESLL